MKIYRREGKEVAVELYSFSNVGKAEERQKRRCYFRPLIQYARVVSDVCRDTEKEIRTNEERESKKEKE